MTLVSLTTNYGRPILFGDLLTTGEKQGRATQIPAFLDDLEEDLPIGQQSFPFELKQKIYVIKEQIAVGLAGNVFQMTQYLKDIKNFFNYHSPTEENFKSFMDSYDPEDMSDCAILVFIIEKLEEGIPPSVHHYGNWEEYNDPLIEVGLITGTGKEAFFNKLARLGFGDGEENKSRATNFALLSMFLADERYTMDSIVDSWGAGFELIEYYGGKFHKLNEYTFVICHSELDETETTVINEPFLIMYYTYHGDILTINTFLVNEFKRYGVLPLDMKKEEADLSTIPHFTGFESSLVLCTFVIEKEDGFFFTTVLHEANAQDERLKVTFDPPERLEVRIDAEISEYVAKEYKASLKL